MIALKQVRLFGKEYAPGESVPDQSWNDLSERNRRVLQSGKYIGPSVVPAKPAGKSTKGR